MTNLWVVRADGGTYADHFLQGGYAGIGWGEMGDLSLVSSRSQMVDLYRQAYPNDTNNVVGNKAGQVHRFLLQIEAGDYVITPRSNSELIYGRVLDESYYFSINNPDGCYYEHRRKVDWATRRLRRSEFSESFQSSIRGQLTVFRVRQCDEFLRVIGDQHAPPIPVPSTDPYRLVLDRLIELDPGEFEFLIGHLMAVMGFADPIVTPLSNDHGIDVRGELDLQGLASVKLVVQVKRYKRTNTIATGAIRQFRADIPMDYQGAFITTSSYQTKARDEAEREGYKRIYLVDERQLVDLLNTHWEELINLWNRNSDGSSDAGDDFGFEEKLGLKRGLVLA